MPVVGRVSLRGLAGRPHPCIEALNDTRVQGHYTINVWCVAGQHYRMVQVVWCRTHATSRDMGPGCPLLYATAAAGAPGDQTPVEALNDTRVQGHYTINIWCVAGRCYRIARMVKC